MLRGNKKIASFVRNRSVKTVRDLFPSCGRRLHFPDVKILVIGRSCDVDIFFRCRATYGRAQVQNRNAISAHKRYFDGKAFFDASEIVHYPRNKAVMFPLAGLLQRIYGNA